MGCGCRQSKVQSMLEERRNSGKTISVKFYHGLGDCCNFCHQIPLYIKRGYRVQVECTADKRPLFESAGAEIVSQASAVHHWSHPPGPGTPLHHDHWSGNKGAFNISKSPMPDIGTYEVLWDEYCAVKLDLDKFLDPKIKEAIDSYINELSCPLVLAHFQGNTGPESKNLSHEEQAKTIKGILDNTDATIILLDWDNRLFKLNNYRARHLIDDWRGLNLLELYYLFQKADLLIGIDSGPLHFARFTDIPVLGVWTGHFPGSFVLPRCNSINMQAANRHASLYPYRRLSYNIITPAVLSGDAIAEQAVRLLSPRKYLKEPASDCMVQHLLDKTRNSSSHLTQYVDRHHSFDFVLNLLKNFDHPVVVETGSIRSVDDFSAGYFGYIMGYFLDHHKGKLHTVELDPTKADFARKWTSQFGDTVHVHTSHSHHWLSSYKGPPIDLLYLDSADTDTPGYQECCLVESQLGLPHLSKNAIVLIDDTVWSKGAFTGKGAKAIFFLKKHGFQIKFSGYQVVLARH